MRGRLQTHQEVQGRSSTKDQNQRLLSLIRLVQSSVIKTTNRVKFMEIFRRVEDRWHVLSFLDSTRNFMCKMIQSTPTMMTPSN